ncbi:SET domain-containing protein-lysine N-methyltransferase [Coleofasciculus chthonoplastes]|jgi:hypothetical protein|uniref:SET domain-containing protein-lysine N-methyltransferase n=1 Tax=Coleofasciculus chthonoplastes TaxID=64178 RepID=UPI0032F3D4A0
MESVELKQIIGKGEGVFATKTFKSRETVMVGIIEEILDKNDSHASQIDENKFARHAGLISKVNHSCDPNCGIRVNQTGGHDFVAIKDIAFEEEITFDYVMRNYKIEHFPKRCLCGALNCRGSITGWKDLPKEKKEEYKSFVAPYLLKLDAQSS